MIAYQVSDMNQSAVIRKVKVTTSTFFFVAISTLDQQCFYRWIKKTVNIRHMFLKRSQGFQVSPQESILFCILS